MSANLDVVNDIARRVLEGEDIPAETMNTAIQALRSERATIAEAKKAKEPAAPMDLASLFNKPKDTPNGSVSST